MSYTIKEVTIKGFKFFKDAFPLNFDGKHVLLYGENGSGKSSIYWSLYTFFQACLKPQDNAQKYFKHGHPQNLRNRFCGEDAESSISVTFMDDSGSSNPLIKISDRNYPFDNPLEKSFMEKSMTSSDFMNYKFLQKLFDFPNSKENEVFEIFEKEVFKYLQFSKPLVDLDGNIRSVTDAESWWKYINTVPSSLPKNTGKNWKTINMSSLRYKSYTRLIDEFNVEMRRALYTLKLNTETIIERDFENSVGIQFQYEPVTFNTIRPGTHKSHDGEIHPPKIILTAKMTDDGVVDESPILHPKSFFNEAKLTCAALAMRMAILGTKPTSGPDYASVLLVDDLLISLDMGYRRKVIDAILKYRIGRQLIILTHDRSFFRLVESEIKRKKETEKWKLLEMCIDEDATIPTPKLIEYSDLISKAKMFYYRHEYAACANTLRRAYENVLKKLLPSHLSLAIKTDSLDNPYQNLNGLISNMGKFRAYYEGFPDLAPNLTNDRQLILNPFSHDDLDTPLFKRELKESIEQLEAISKAEKTVIVDEQNVHVTTYKMEMHNGEYVSYAEFVFLGVWDKVSYEGVEYYGNPQVRVLRKSENVRTKDIVGLNNLHHAVSNAINLNKETAPKCKDCVTEVPVV